MKTYHPEALAAARKLARREADARREAEEARRDQRPLRRDGRGPVEYSPALKATELDDRLLSRMKRVPSSQIDLSCLARSSSRPSMPSSRASSRGRRALDLDMLPEKYLSATSEGVTTPSRLPRRGGVARGPRRAAHQVRRRSSSRGRRSAEIDYQRAQAIKYKATGKPLLWDFDDLLMWAEGDVTSPVFNKHKSGRSTRRGR